MSSSKNLVKREEFEGSLVEVVIIKMNKRTSNKINKELIQATFCNKPLALQGFILGPLG